MQKYKTLIDHYMDANSGTKIHNLTSDSVVFGSSSIGGSTMFYLTQTFNQLTVQWKIDSPIFGKHQLEWDFPEHENQNRIIDLISKDLINYQKKILEVERLEEKQPTILYGKERLIIKKIQLIKDELKDDENYVRIETTKTKFHIENETSVNCFIFSVHNFKILTERGGYKLLNESYDDFIGATFNYDFEWVGVGEKNNVNSDFKYDYSGFVRSNESVVISTAVIEMNKLIPIAQTKRTNIAEQLDIAHKNHIRLLENDSFKFYSQDEKKQKIEEIENIIIDLSGNDAEEYFSNLSHQKRKEIEQISKEGKKLGEVALQKHSAIDSSNPNAEKESRLIVDILNNQLDNLDYRKRVLEEQIESLIKKAKDLKTKER